MIEAQRKLSTDPPLASPSFHFASTEISVLLPSIDLAKNIRAIQSFDPGGTVYV
jgi:hypothetical protein